MNLLLLLCAVTGGAVLIALGTFALAILWVCIKDRHLPQNNPPFYRQ
jgi:hypothetical protein